MAEHVAEQLVMFVQPSVVMESVKVLKIPVIVGKIAQYLKK